MKTHSQLSICAALAALITVAASTVSHRNLAGCVLVAGQPLAGATLTLYAAGPAEPARLAEGKTDDHGAFELNTGQPTRPEVSLRCRHRRAEPRLGQQLAIGY